MTSFATPEEAARAGLREEYVRVVGTVVRGDEAVVAQVMNADGYPDAYEIETAVCHRDARGWELGSSGNDNVKFIQTGADRCTVVWWGEGRQGAIAVRLRLGDQESTVPVDDGFFFAVFDDVPWHMPVRDFPELPAGASGYMRIVKGSDDGEPGSNPPAVIGREVDWFHPWPKVEEWIDA